MVAGDPLRVGERQRAGSDGQRDFCMEEVSSGIGRVHLKPEGWLRCGLSGEADRAKQRNGGEADRAHGFLCCWRDEAVLPGE